MTPFTTEERMTLVERLDDKGLFLRSLWGLTEVYYTDQVKTAAVQIVNDTIQMVFNKEFWESLGPDGQLFVVCHEQLHLMMDHFKRLRFDLGDAGMKNKAADVAINHMLIRNYYFVKEHLPNWERYCWVTTCFPEQKVTDNETAEYYYALLKQRQEKNEDIGGETLDDHQFGDADGGEHKSLPPKIKEAIKEAAKEVEEHCNNNDVGDGNHELQAGTESGNHDQVHNTYVKPKKSWKKVYKKIPKRLAGTKIKPHWLFTERRQHLISTTTMMPGNMEVDNHDKVKVHVYLDTSGSCIEDAKYFLEQSLSLPRKLFDVKIFGFDCKVYPVSRTPPYKLTGFGGTSFQTIVNHMENSPGTVDAALVFTDGFAPKAICKHPKKWHWFITPDGTDQLVPDNSNTYMLIDFDWKS